MDSFLTKQIASKIRPGAAAAGGILPPSQPQKRPFEDSFEGNFKIFHLTEIYDNKIHFLFDKFQISKVTFLR